ncbi:hypothetical protein [Dyadobacter sp. MSC1_007]|jgi:hypothetical protein|uniref:hypothetical protein n=1 Tax=Dyadobacter sp. MSC1_007 TaxID=2909264 RepID=UPI00202EBE62|nr:hypothetical protein [Dyadobacter sp. MSC1_007]
MSDSKNEISDLCVSCGMCCDGTLFASGQVRDEADRSIADGLEMTTFELKGKLFFKQPCHHFSSCCTVYGEQRPHVCSAFFCNPVRKHKRGEQTFEDASQQVHWLLEQRDKLMKIASQFPELKDLDFRSLKDKLEEYAEDSEKVSLYKHLYLIFYIFLDLRDRYFPIPGKSESLTS